MKNLVVFWVLFVIPLGSVHLNAQNYLYKKDYSGLSGYVGVFSEDLKTRNAYGFGADFTAKGFFSVGLSRIVVNNGFNSNNGVTSLNASITPVKKEKGNLTFSVPLFISKTLSKNNSVFTYGASLAVRNQLKPTSSLTPVLALGFNSVDDYRGGTRTVGAISFELNILANKFRLAPSISFSEQNALFGIAAGLVL
jgi:hypothetical protein